VTKNPGTMIGPKTLIQRKYPLAEGTEGTDLYLTKHGFEIAFASDVPKKLADQMWAEQRPFSQEAFASLSGEPAWKTIPSWYLVATQDHAIPPGDADIHGKGRARHHLYGQGLSRPDGLAAHCDDRPERDRGRHLVDRRLQRNTRR
jgi:hypothetical protein